MAFVNEFIPEADFVKYDIAAINRYYLTSNYKSEWTVDRERDIYLREVAAGREEFAGEYTYTLYWKSDLIRLRLRKEGNAHTDLTALRDYVMLELKLPPHLESKQAEILTDLKEALVARNGSGIYSPYKQTIATFDF